MSQTSVDFMPVAVDGLLADDSFRKNCRAAHNEEATDPMPFGIMVALGTEDDGALLLAANTDKLKGVVVFGQKYDRTLELSDDGLLPGTSFDLLRHGQIYVRPEDAVTPASQVHVRAVADPMMGEQAGAFRGSKDGTDTIDITKFAKWLTSADAGELAVVEIDMTNASEAAADS